MEFALQSIINPWVAQHPLIMWLLQHPIISVISLLLSVALLLRLFSAIAFLLDKLWIWLLKSPVLLVKFLLRNKTTSVKKTTVITRQHSTIEPEKISQIIEYLETINQQQQQIMQDIALLKQQNNSSTDSK